MAFADRMLLKETYLVSEDDLVRVEARRKALIMRCCEVVTKCSGLCVAARDGGPRRTATARAIASACTRGKQPMCDREPCACLSLSLQ